MKTQNLNLKIIIFNFNNKINQIKRAVLKNNIIESKSIKKIYNMKIKCLNIFFIL